MLHTQFSHAAHAGIVVRFMNGNLEGNGVRDPMSANNLIGQVRTALRNHMFALVMLGA